MPLLFSLSTVTEVCDRRPPASQHSPDILCVLAAITRLRKYSPEISREMIRLGALTRWVFRCWEGVLLGGWDWVFDVESYRYDGYMIALNFIDCLLTFDFPSSM